MRTAHEYIVASAERERHCRRDAAPLLRWRSSTSVPAGSSRADAAAACPEDQVSEADSEPVSEPDDENKEQEVMRERVF